MTTTAVKVSQAVAEWTKIFPKTVTETLTGSTTFMKQLTVVALSTITYLKNVFPEENYTVDCFGGVKLRILKKKCRDEMAQFLSTSLTQAFEAFEKKYLHQLALCFYEKECKPENLLEYHLFEYTYTPQGVTMDLRSKGQNKERSLKCTFEGVRERTINLVRTCVVMMEAFQELPDTYDVSLRLYYNESAPPGYQAPGFAPTEGDDHLEPYAPSAIKIGWVETPYHKFVAKSYVNEEVKASHEANASISSPKSTLKDLQELSDMSIGSKETVRLRCPCNKQDEESALITCIYCKYQQHAVCYGLLDPQAKASQHCCCDCSNQNPSRIPTDVGLVGLSARKQECLCIFRRTLELCWQEGFVDGQRLMNRFNISASNAKKLLKLLASHEIIPQDFDKDDLNTPVKIMADPMKTFIEKYFTPSCDTIVDRVLADTFTSSQESLSDPVGEVLGPLEAVKLHQESQLGRVIEDTGDEAFRPDSISKKYRRDVTSPEKVTTDVLPNLSGTHNPKSRLAKSKANKRRADEPNSTTQSGVKSKRAKGSSY